MRRTLGSCVVILLVLACSGKKKPAVEPPTPDAIPAAAIAPPVTPPDAAPPPPPERKLLRLTLRSTPPGAAVKIDGRPAGSTPTVAQVEADNQVHEFVFSLDGYAPHRITFTPIQDGVVYGTLKSLTAPDAGDEE